MAKKSAKPDPKPALKKLLLEILSEHPYQPMNYKQVMKKYTYNPYYEIAEPLEEEFGHDGFKQLTIDTLAELAESGDIEQTDRGKYRSLPVAHFITGKIDIVSSGAAYVMNEEYEDDIYIARGSTLNAMNGDTVKVSLYARRKGGGKLEGEVVEVLERARTEFVGIIQLSEKFAFLVSDARNSVDIFIPLSKLNGGQDGMKAVAKITHWDPEAKNPQGEIIKVLGRPGENNAEMDAILVEFGFPLEFPKAVEQEAEDVPNRIPRKEISKRKDFRKVTTFTIDPVDAKDFDDALSIKKLEGNHYEIGIHIADVSYYVTPGSALDDEAIDRATSVYLVDRVIPMLPEKLSNNVCSLRPGEDKLCYSAVFEMDEHANVISEWFGRTIIHSDKRFTYEEAQAVIETGKGPFSEEILLMDRMAKTMRAERFRKGAISFEKLEVKFRLDEKGMPVDVYLKENKDSNKLIEEFMLLANRRVAEYVGKKLANEKGREHPFVYRVHDTPSDEKLGRFAMFAGKFGYRINTNSDREIAHSLNKLMKDVHGKKEQNVLEQLAVRTMAKAIYTVDNIGHYGLAFEYYTHFTSPIRRYPDVMVHRLLEHYLEGGKPVKSDELQMKCKHSTEMEIKASEAERASIKFKQVQFMMGHEGEIFDGLISGVTEWGLYVELVDNKCEGLIRVRDLDDDFYELDEENYCLIGRRSRKKFGLGDSVKVELKSTDLARKQIDFLLYDIQNRREERGVSFDRRDERGRGSGGGRGGYGAKRAPGKSREEKVGYGSKKKSASKGKKKSVKKDKGKKRW